MTKMWAKLKWRGKFVTYTGGLHWGDGGSGYFTFTFGKLSSHPSVYTLNASPTHSVTTFPPAATSLQHSGDEQHAWGRV